MAIRKQLAAVLTGAEQEMRVRLVLAVDGQCRIEIFPFTTLPEQTVWRLAISSTRLNSSNPLLRHKTTLRQVYETARSEFPADQVDEVLLLNEKDEVCEGTISNIFVLTQENILLTPTLECGLLAGVLRRQMLDEGKAQEAKILVNDLLHAKALFVGNSLRGLIKAQLHDSAELY